MGTVRFGRIIKLLFIISILYFLIYFIPQGFRLLYPLHFEDIIHKYSKEYQIEAPMIAAVIKTESNFFTFAESPKGARGLMQITPSTGKWIADKLKVENYSDESLYEPEINIRFGCWYIRHLHEYFGNDMRLVLAAYNGGRGNVDKWLKDSSLSEDGKTLDVIPFKETDEFIKRVKRNYNIYTRLYNWSNITEDGDTK
ncbi:MAG: lytic transglycosylase domain-containing protein [Bacillota bacterium]